MYPLSPSVVMPCTLLITLQVAEALYVVFWFYRKTFCRVTQFGHYLTLMVDTDLLCYTWQNIELNLKVQHNNKSYLDARLIQKLIYIVNKKLLN